MYLKRGRIRKACDFCHIRKKTCNRVQRQSQGHPQCSQCSIRQIDCKVDDSNDIRLERTSQVQISSESTDVNQGSTGDQPILQTNSASLQTHNLAAPLFAEDLNPHVSNDYLQLFDLSNEGISYLSQVFIGYDTSSDWITDSTPSLDVSEQSTSPMGMSSAFTSNSTASKGLLAASQIAISVPEINDEEDFLGLDLGEDHSNFMRGARAYFEYAATYLPVIFEDTFWEDYKNAQCGKPLVYAVACRGMPYTNIPDKWDVQQRFASKFREAFLMGRSQSSSLQDAVRLDDIEALTLMSDFHYREENNQGGSSQILSNLANLFLRHDSLVLMTLRAREQQKGDGLEDMTKFARSKDRQLLLFWHVYGLDAFGCLDRRAASYIPNQLIDPPKKTWQCRHKGYLDAILSLAIIARHSLEALCSVATKKNGAKLSDIRWLYKELEMWENEGCPRHVRKQTCRTADNKLDPFSSNEEGEHGSVSLQRSLRRTVLWLLEANCYLQIHSCVEEYGMQDAQSLQAEAVTLKIESETMRIFNDLVEICEAIRDHNTQQERKASPNAAQHSLSDLAPTLVRNICAGACYWACTRGINTSAISKSSLEALRHGPGGNEYDLNEPQASDRRENYRKAALILREVVASASSHEDTRQVLGRIDPVLEQLLE